MTAPANLAGSLRWLSGAVIPQFKMIDIAPRTKPRSGQVGLGAGDPVAGEEVQGDLVVGAAGHDQRAGGDLVRCAAENR
jgi:hypothetical protein